MDLLNKYRKYQTCLNDDQLLTELYNDLSLKINSIFKSIKCDYSYHQDFKQECLHKLFMVAKDKHFSDDANDVVVRAYFENVFRTVKRDFIRKYHLYEKITSLDSRVSNGGALIDIIKAPDDPSIEIMITAFLSCAIVVLNPNDYDFLMLFFDGITIKRVTEVAHSLGVSHQAVSKRLNRILSLLESQKLNNRLLV